MKVPHLDSQKCEERAARGPWPCLRTPEKLRVWTGASSDRSGGPVSAVARAGRPDLVHHSVSDMVGVGVLDPTRQILGFFST